MTAEIVLGRSVITRTRPCSLAADWTRSVRAADQLPSLRARASGPAQRFKWPRLPSRRVQAVPAMHRDADWSPAQEQLTMLSFHTRR